MAGGRRTVRIVWALWWAAVALVLVVRATSRPATRGVILDHLEFGRRLLDGDDVYGPWKSDPDAPVRPLHAPYPPSFGLLTAPFAVLADTLGNRAARFAWALLQVLALGAIAWELRRLTAARPPPPSSWNWLWLGAFLLGARFILRDTHGGGGNLINIALCLLAFGAAERDRPGRAGLLLGLSLATKPTQIWLLPLLLVFGRRRAALYSALALAGCVLLTLLLQRFDVGPFGRWLGGSFAIATQSNPWANPALDFPPFEWMNQSLRLCMARWCGTVPAEFAERVSWGVIPGLGLGSASVGWLARLLALGLLGWLLCAGRGAHQRASARLWVFAAALVLSVLLSPLSWKAHHVALLPVLFLLLQYAVVHRSRGTAIVLGMWALMCALPGRDLVGDAADEWCNSIYIVTIWDLALLALALRLARSSSHQHDDAADRAG